MTKKCFIWMMLTLFGSLIHTATAADVLPEAGKSYYIISDNVDAQKADQDYYLYDNNGTLSLAKTNEANNNYVWTCEKNGENFRFKNVESGKYLGYKVMSTTAYDFKIDPAQKVNEGCLPLYAINNSRYMLVKNGGSEFNHADKTYNKASSGFSSDYIFKEVDLDAPKLIIETNPADAEATFSWNNESIYGAGIFELAEEGVSEATLNAQVTDPASIYAFEGFYEGEIYLGQNVEIEELTAVRTITAKFRLNIFSENYGDKWIRVTANRNPGNMMNLPIKESYLNVAPNTAATDMSSKNQIWCFVGNESSFKIYNLAAGEQFALSTEGTSYGDGTKTKMIAANEAISWHLVDKSTGGVAGLNISPAGNNAFGLNPYGAIGNDLKLYYNGDGGNMWGFQMAGNSALKFRIEINGTPKALNTNVGQITLKYGKTTNTMLVTTSAQTEQNIYLTDGVELNFEKGNIQYRGYKFDGFKVGNGELQQTIKNLPFSSETTNITAVYSVDETDPSQYLFYTPGYQNKPYRIPAITTLNNGNILAISDFRWCGADIGNGHVDIVGRISKDNGATWGEQFNIAVGSGIEDAKDCGYGDAAVVTDRESGRILIMCCTGSVFYAYGTRENPLRSARLYSEDNGETWSKPEDITEQMYALLPNSTGQFIGAGKICQSRQVKVGEYYRLYAALCTRPGGNYVIYSDDFGQTWKVLGSNTVSCAPGGDEPKCEELPDGSVVLSSRKYSGRYFNIYKYTNVETGEGNWTGVVSSNDVENGLRFNWNSTNGEIQFVKVIKKSDNSFHYMMIQSAPYGRVNEGDAERSNVAIHYKVFDNYFMDSALDLATNWTMGMRLENPKGAYSTMCIQPDKKLGFFYEEGPNDYCMVYRPISIEELTNDEYRMYDPETDGAVDEKQRALDMLRNEMQTLLNENASNHAATPALGQYPTVAYNALQAAKDALTIENMATAKNTIAEFKATRNYPVFTINNMHPTYGVGKSIYDDGQASLHFKETNANDPQMLWKFEGLTSETMSTGTYIVTNLSTGKLFWNAKNLTISNTNPATEGQFIIKTNGTGDPIHAQNDYSVIVRWNDYKPNTGSAWSFTYVGNSFDLENQKVIKYMQLQELISAFEMYPVGTEVGQYTTTEGYETILATAKALTAESDEADLDASITAMQSLIDALTLNMPETGKFYRIQSKTSGKFIVSHADNDEKAALIDDGTGMNTVFFLSADNRMTGYQRLNIKETANFDQTGIGSDFNFAASPYIGYYTIRVNGNTSGAFYDYSDKSGKVDTWSDSNDEKCAWKLIEVTDPTMQPKLTKNMNTEYATLAAPVSLKIPEGIKAFTAQVNGQKATLIEVTGGFIPAGTAVVLQKTGTEKDYTFNFDATETVQNESNHLVGVYVETPIPAETKAYILAQPTGKEIGFYLLNDTDRNITANKAYLVAPTEAAGIKAFTFDFGGTTGIDNTEATTEAEEYYDLQGRRVMNPTKGFYITKNGKKVIIKK